MTTKKTPATKPAAKTKTTPIPADEKLRLVKKDNPFREGTNRHKRFASLKSGMTVGEARKATTSGFVRFLIKREMAVLD